MTQLTPSALEETAQVGTEEMVRSWFGRDPNMMFFYVPQVAVYQAEGIPVKADWVDQPGQA